MAGTMLSDRAVLRVSGADVRGWLQGLVTQDVTGALPVWAGLLTPQGKVLFDFLVWDEGEDLLLDCEGRQAEALAKRLSLYRLRRAITIERDEALAVHWAVDGEAGVADPRLAALGRRWLAEPGKAADGWRAHRLRLGVTEGVEELGSGETLWLECNADALGGVSYVKGCYVGQENTARMHHRSKVNRRLVVLPTGQAPEERVRRRYPELGLEVAHMRVEDLRQDDVPGWLGGAL